MLIIKNNSRIKRNSFLEEFETVERGEGVIVDDECVVCDERRRGEKYIYNINNKNNFRNNKYK